MAAKNKSQGQGGIIFNTELGQHILKNPLVVQSMVEKVKSIEQITKQSILIHN